MCIAPSIATRAAPTPCIDYGDADGSRSASRPVTRARYNLDTLGNFSASRDGHDLQWPAGLLPTTGKEAHGG